MKRTIKNGKMMVLSTVLGASVIMSGFSMADTTTYGAASASTDTSYTLEEMLTYAIEDEYIARAEYELIMDEFGVLRPFSNIMKSEETHISLLTPLFEAYGIDMPADPSSHVIALPDTLAETFAVGVEAEINNIAMYEKFLATELPDDVRDVFERLKAASENHLKAFENGASRSTTTRGNLSTLSNQTVRGNQPIRGNGYRR